MYEVDRKEKHGNPRINYYKLSWSTKNVITVMNIIENYCLHRDDHIYAIMKYCTFVKKNCLTIKNYYLYRAISTKNHSEVFTAVREIIIIV